MSSIPPVREFLAILGEPTRAGLERSPRLLQLLGEALHRGGAPVAGGAGRQWMCYLADRFPPADDLERALSVWCTADLRLCYACLTGEPGAAAVFHRRARPVIASTLARLRLGTALREEIEQQLLGQLLVGAEGRPPLLASYRGLGILEHWLRIVTARTARKALGREKRLPVSDEELVGQMIDPRGHAERLSAQQVYRDAFREAFRRAAASLGPREVTLLRQRYSDGLTLQQIAAVYRVHHATVHRWLEEIRRRLLVETRQHMAERLSISDGEWATVMRLIQSHLNFTIRTLLAQTDASTPDLDGGAR